MAAYQHALVFGRVAYATETANRARVALRTAEQAFAQSDGEQKRVSAQADDLEIESRSSKRPSRWSRRARPTLRARGRDSSSARSLGARRQAALRRHANAGPRRPPRWRPPKWRSTTSRSARRPNPAGPHRARHARPGAVLGGADVRPDAPRRLTRAWGGPTSSCPSFRRWGAFAPIRDDRGVVVTLRGTLLGQPARPPRHARQLASLGHVAVAHPEFPSRWWSMPSRGPKGAHREDTAAHQEAWATSPRPSSEGGVPAERIAGGSRGLCAPGRRSDHVSRHRPERADRDNLR